MSDATSGANNNAYETNTANLTNGQVETSKAERHVWLMKCPPVVSRSLHHYQQQQQQKQQRDVAPSLSDGPIAKVVVAVDPLLPNDNFSSTKFTMELAGTESGNVPTCYSMDMSTDFIPMSVFSESAQANHVREP